MAGFGGIFAWIVDKALQKADENTVNNIMICCSVRFACLFCDNHPNKDIIIRILKKV